MNTIRVGRNLFAATLVALCAANAAAQNTARIDPAKARVIEHWTAERRANAIPRDLVIDPRGLGYLRGRGGVLEPYGHNVAAQVTEKAREPTPSPFGKPGGETASANSTLISNMNPDGSTPIGGTHTFSATVADGDGIRSVSFRVWRTNGVKQSFSASKAPGNDDWSVKLQGFTDGKDWHWEVVAKDASGKGGVTTTSTTVDFEVATGGSAGTGSGTGVVTNADWTDHQSGVYKAAGRLYFEMPRNAKRTSWVGYVCSGTVVDDSVDGVNLERSRILTAAHCVYDDANKAFARNVMFIPQQADTTGTGTDLNCNNDPIGCWVPSYGVVDFNWTNGTFPNNKQWDYAFYVVADTGAHRGIGSAERLDTATAPLTISFSTPFYTGSNDLTHALGYSYNQDPKFMYCAEDMTTEGAVNWWLPSCGLSGGSSGGPWIQPFSSGSGPIISVNSWGYTTSPGMAGPKLDVSASARAVFDCAIESPPLPVPDINDGSEGVVRNATGTALCDKKW